MPSVLLFVYRDAGAVGHSPDWQRRETSHLFPFPKMACPRPRICLKVIQIKRYGIALTGICVRHERCFV